MVVVDIDGAWMLLRRTFVYGAEYMAPVYIRRLFLDFDECRPLLLDCDDRVFEIILWIL